MKDSLYLRLYLMIALFMVWVIVLLTVIFAQQYMEYRQYMDRQNLMLRCQEAAAHTDNSAWDYQNCLRDLDLLDYVKGLTIKIT